MLLLHYHHRQEWLEQDFEIPQELTDTKLYVNCVRMSKDSNLLSMQLSSPPRGGIWERSGKLVFLPANAKDVVLLPKEKELLVLERVFRKVSPNNTGVPCLLKRLEFSTRKVLAQGEIITPHNIGQSLIVAPKGDKALVTWHEQVDWGYATVDLHQMRQLPQSFEWHTLTDSPPSFSPDGKLVVSCNFVRPQAWWAGEDGGDPQDPSPGGTLKVSTIVVHDLESGQTSQHDLLVTVDEGWLPDRPDEREWQQVWGPEFMSDQQFRIWLPDDSEEMLTLPLPPRIEIKRPLKNTRVWPD
jgi:hypothetical protein